MTAPLTTATWAVVVLYEAALLAPGAAAEDDRHMADVGRGWFRRIMAGQDAPHFSSGAGPDGAFDGAVPDPAIVAQAREVWRAEAAFAGFTTGDQTGQESRSAGRGAAVRVTAMDITVHASFLPHDAPDASSGSLSSCS